MGEATERSSKHNRSVAAEIPCWGQWRDAAHQIKRHTVANLDKLLVEFERNITARGAEVLWAKDAEEANKLVIDIARRHDMDGTDESIHHNDYPRGRL